MARVGSDDGAPSPPPPASRRVPGRARGASAGNRPRPDTGDPSSAPRATPGATRARGTARAGNGAASPATTGAESPVTGEPASRRALRTQGRRTMRRLLDAAMIVFAKRGYHAARVDDIVKVARTSHGTFYLYFSNKEDLLRALVSEAGEVVTALDNALGPVGPDDEGWRELRGWVASFSEQWQHYAPVIRAWTDLVMSDPELTEQAQVAAGSVASTLARRIAESGPPAGIDPNAAAEAVVAMVDRFHYLRQFANEPVDDPAIDTLTTMIHRALFGGGDPPAATDGAPARRTVPARSPAARGQSR